MTGHSLNKSSCSSCSLGIAVRPKAEQCVVCLFVGNNAKEISVHSAKQAARELIEQLPESVSWDDLMYELYVKQKIEEGLKELDEGRGIPHEEVKRGLLSDTAPRDE